MGHSKLLAAALSYLRRGWPVVPLNPASKIPAVKWLQYQTQLPTEDQVISWWTERPDASIGVLTGAISGLVAVDLDGPTGLQSAHERGVVSSRISKSRRGAHLLFRHPGHYVKTRAGLFPGVDIRGDGGLFVAPPSKRSDGLEYFWLLDGVIPPLPPCLSGRSLEPKRNPEGWIAEKAAHLAPGNRHNTFVSLVGRCHRDGWSAGDIQAVLAPMAAAAADFDVDELGQIIDSIVVKPRPTAVEIVTGQTLLATPDPVWLVQQAIPLGSIALVSGVPGSGKSLLLLDTAVALASQKPLTALGVGTAANRVLYIDAENGQVLVAQRLRQILEGRGHELPPSMNFLFDGFRLDTADGLAKLEGHVATLKPSVLFLDSLIQFHGQNENDSVAMTAVMNSLRMLREKYGLTIICLHHETKMAYQLTRDNVAPTAGDCRGSSAIAASCETIFSVRKRAGGMQVYHTKSRCGEALAPIQIVLDNTTGLCLRAGTEEEADGNS